MALTINPAVSGGHKRWVLDSAAFLAGTFFGGLVSLALVLTLVSVLRHLAPDHLVVALVVGVVVCAALHDLGLPFPLPYRQRQVPEWLRDVLPPTAIALTYGFMLGVGFITLFTYSTHLAVLSALPFIASTSAVFAVVATFAIGKTLVVATTFGSTRLEQIAPRFRWSKMRIRILRLTTASASLAIGALLLMES